MFALSIPPPPENWCLDGVLWFEQSMFTLKAVQGKKRFGRYQESVPKMQGKMSLEQSTLRKAGLERAEHLLRFVRPIEAESNMERLDFHFFQVP